MGKSKSLKQQEANERKEKRERRSPSDQIALLDAKFGKNVGAKKERERLLEVINKKVSKSEKTEDAIEEDSEKPAKKKSKKKKKDE